MVIVDVHIRHPNRRIFQSPRNQRCSYQQTIATYPKLMIQITDIYTLGRYRNAQNIPPCPLRNRSRGSRRNRGRASPPRYQRQHNNNPRNLRLRTTRLPPRSPIPSIRNTKIPRRRSGGDYARQSPNRISSSGRTEFVAGFECGGGEEELGGRMRVVRMISFWWFI
jgi:hypothetical protein